MPSPVADAAVNRLGRVSGQSYAGESEDTMNDRDLLELAAKAAGYEHYRYCAVHMALVPEPEGEDALPFSVWNPLTDDGDALRLAVKLGLTIECDFSDSDSCVASETRGDVLVDEASGMLGELIGHPEFAATRRAITRAAAEIGRSMP